MPTIVATYVQSKLRYLDEHQEDEVGFMTASTEPNTPLTETDSAQARDIYDAIKEVILGDPDKIKTRY